ncbi:MAG: hypothetical protein KGD59_00800 [Candidatus Heimdallarchaeota archaeon]|nr:hypothetical protein [Candidatus Heimdallarchaeota archaeon]MBY8993056.1 hypothetical protein [Candidatus Heimdallarchaeota archaeon]
MYGMESKKEHLLGIVFVTFEDTGPSVIFNDTDLTEEQTLTLAVEGMTIVGLDEGSQGKTLKEKKAQVFDTMDDKRSFGPLPVPDAQNLRAMAITFDVESVDSADHRITEFGRKCILFLLFKEDYTREILDAYGLIKPYFSVIVRDITTENHLTQANLQDMSRKMGMLFSGKLPRVFTLTDDGSPKELIGKKIPASDVFLVADKNKSTLSILFYHPDPTVWRRRQIYKSASELNSSVFKNKLKVISVTEIAEMSKILDRLNVSIEKIH